MEQEARWHAHTIAGVIQTNPPETYGYLLEPGDTLEEGDLYNSTSGKWESSPMFAGSLLFEGCKTTWVRPFRNVPQSSAA